MATLDKDLLNDWLVTMVRAFLGTGMTPEAFAAAVVADASESGTALESGDWGGSFTKKLVLAPGETLRFSKGESETFSCSFVKETDAFRLYVSASDGNTAVTYYPFTLDLNSGLWAFEGIVFDNTISGLTATTVKTAIDELKALIDAL